MRYLSDEWFAAADEAVRTASPAPLALVIDQHVDSVASWRITMGTVSSIERLDGDGAGRTPADASFRQSLATAEAIARGETDSHQAFLLGDVRFEGDIDAVIERSDALQWLREALVPVMARTRWS